MVGGGQFGREVVEYVSRASQTGQQDQRLSEAAPIEHLELDVLLHRYELRAMRRWVSPSRFFGGMPKFEWKRQALSKGAADGCPVSAECAIVTALDLGDRELDVGTIQRK